MMVVVISLLLLVMGLQADEPCFHEISPSPIKLLKPEAKTKPDQKVDSQSKKTEEQKTDSGKKAEAPKKNFSFFSNKTINNMNFDELKEAKEKLIKDGNKTSAIKYLEKMMPLCNDLDELKRIMLELAQLYFEQDNFEKAGKMYNEFTILYPGCDEAEFALYQAILSSFKLTLDAEHDQTKTKEAKELALSFLERQSFTKYRNEVKDILNKSEERLFEADSKIFSFYLNSGNYTGEYGNAKQHLAIIKDLYLDNEIPEIKIPDIALRIAKLEADYTAATMPIESSKTVVAQTKEPQKKPFKNRF